jgi:penicillin amidase
MMALQTDTRDFLASEITPRLANALAGDQLTSSEQQARDLLGGWDFRMETGSAAASIWSTFWQSYLSQEFDSVWKAKKVKVARQELDDALGQYLEALTLASRPSCPTLAACPLDPKVESQDLSMRAAFHDAFSILSKKLGGEPQTWTWDKLHTRTLENLAAVPGLDYGPRPDRGDGNTPLAAGGSPSTHGPSWRMVVDWGAKTFSGMYPGGQSENPASSLYVNKVDAWWSGLYAPMLSADQASFAPGVATWAMQP